MRPASELPRKSPVPIAPPMAIILGWLEESSRDSCSPFSMAPGGKLFARFIGFAGTSRRIERTQQLDRGCPRVLHAMAYAYGEVNAAASPEFTRFVVGVHNPLAFQDENAFLIGVVVDRGFAGRNPAHELGDLSPAKVDIDQVAEQTV